jgi:hypothetical protein
MRRRGADERDEEQQEQELPGHDPRTL